jgi:tetratricopeptide (TPR) repeat protein
MFRPGFSGYRQQFAVLLLCLFAISVHSAIYAQAGDSIPELKQKVIDLKSQQRYTEMLPLLEKIVRAEPDNAEMNFYLGFALIAEANNTVENSERKALRVRARQAFLTAKQLGINEPLVDGLLQNLPVDGSEGDVSQNLQAEALMREAEAFYAQGKIDDALTDYQRALLLDPKLYEAALFSGDVYMQKDNFDQAEVWYQRAIKIDPNRETAYRYSGTPLMKQKKFDEARDRYIEAFICEPYNRMAVQGIVQWAQVTKAQLAHPKIDIPTEVTFDEKGDAKINLDASALLSGKDDGSFAWISYGTTRSLWHKEKFRSTFPKEQTYRHSLAEEADALRSVITLATADKKTKVLSPSLAALKKLNDEGLLEAYILLARADDGIASDYPAYRNERRDKLRMYVLKYVVTPGN